MHIEVLHFATTTKIEKYLIINTTWQKWECVNGLTKQGKVVDFTIKEKV